MGCKIYILNIMNMTADDLHLVTDIPKASTDIILYICMYILTSVSIL